ncbi:MAG: hypothetical protein M3160_06860 [Candidatus Eremiobacteraeota bacterium]|nr:hypothetical protein [Candidatus Eremiobacteraeota bacterium]
MIEGLGARAHLFVRPTDREQFITLFRHTLACNVVERDFGMAHPILVVIFGDGSRMSVEFTDDAPGQRPGVLDDAHASRGAWLELRTSDVLAVQQKLREAGVPSFSHPGSAHVYFSVPGGQVFRVVDLAYQGP